MTAVTNRWLSKAGNPKESINKAQQIQKPSSAGANGFLSSDSPPSRENSSGDSGQTNPNHGSIRQDPEEPSNAMESLWQKANQLWTSPLSKDRGFVSSSTSIPTVGCTTYPPIQPWQHQIDSMADVVGQACHSCHAVLVDDDAAVLGIARLAPPETITLCNFGRIESSMDRRRQRYERRLRMAIPPPNEEIEVSPNHCVQVNLPPTHGASSTDGLKGAAPDTTPPSSYRIRLLEDAPFEELQLTSDAADLERSISELTMRSSYAEHFPKIPDNRRMAYYAVGKHHRQSGRGGNRRCYFTGKLILGGAPFYAGSVQQGLRTLVVFCLPSAVGLPHKEDLANYRATRNSANSGNNTVYSGAPPSREHSRSHGTSNRSVHSNKLGVLSRRKHSGGGCGSSVASKSMLSRLSSLDDLSLSVDGDLDPNWGLDRDFLIKVLPSADDELLEQMSMVYPEQFVTLPVQVRDARMWKLYVKFCFFSGLPISEGEMHYKVHDALAQEVYGEEIVLSHEVMEAVNGASADILMLPNIKTFGYLRKHYSQQCSKLSDAVFQRSSWERVAPEV